MHMQAMHGWTIAVLVAVAGVAAGGGAGGGAVPSRQIVVAAASDLQVVLPEIARRFRDGTGITAKVSLGSSGSLYAQLRNGAPYDVFMSADVDYPRELVAKGDADAASLLEYATGRLVLWTRKGSGIDVERGLTVLRAARVRRVAIANPAHAPYGRAAIAALRHEGLHEAVRPRLVFGENVSQAAQFVESGNADAGIIALSLALGPSLERDGVYFLIPAAAHPPIRQAAVVIAASRDRDAARQFVRFLRQREVAALLERSGFDVPATAAE